MIWCHWLRLLFAARKPTRRLPKLQRYRLGRELVDIANRDALYDAMEER